jgi:6-phosphogluconolactonase
MDEMLGQGAVYVQTNDAHNEVIAFARAEDGALTRIGEFATGGKGLGAPHLTSQGSVMVTGDGRHLLVTNAASDDISLFAITPTGLELIETVATGAGPKSVDEHDGLVYVLNTGEPGLTGFRVEHDRLAPVAGSERMLGSNADPAQVGFTPDGTALVVTQRGTDSIVSLPVGSAGMLGEPQEVTSSGPTPYGFAITADGALVVTEAFRAEKGAAAASSYRLRGSSIEPVTSSVGNGRSEICWAVATPDGRFVFTTNFADGAVSRYAIGSDGTLSLEDAAAGTAVEGHTGLRDEGITADGRFLYVIDADAGMLFGWEVGGQGSLTPIGSWPSLPASVAGLAVR